MLNRRPGVEPARPATTGAQGRTLSGGRDLRMQQPACTERCARTRPIDRRAAVFSLVTCGSSSGSFRWARTMGVVGKGGAHFSFGAWVGAECSWELSRLLNAMQGRQAARKQRELAEAGSGRRGAAGLKGCWPERTCQAAIAASVENGDTPRRKVRAGRRLRHGGRVVVYIARDAARGRRHAPMCFLTTPGARLDLARASSPRCFELDSDRGAGGLPTDPGARREPRSAACGRLVPAPSERLTC
jgi:hypothetical protein